MITTLLQPEVQQFIRDHEKDDPVSLILQAHRFPGIPVKEAVEQIQSRKKAKAKLPDWYGAERVIYPPKLSLEQCSSTLTAKYKAGLTTGKTMVDLTGGMGVDTLHLSHSFDQTYYVEQNENLVAIARHNFKALGASNIQCFHGTSGPFLEKTKPVDLAFLDPARRGSDDRKIFMLSDCQPNVISLLPSLKKKAGTILLKTAPLLDIKQGVEELGGVSEVHVIAVNNEVKELLFLVRSTTAVSPMICCVNFKKDEKETFTFSFEQEGETEVPFGEISQYLYEPNAAILKGGAFKTVARSFNLIKLHPNSHLYTADTLKADFPGRVFKVIDRVTWSKKSLKKAIPHGRAHISVRNYPQSVQELRQQSGLKEGGNTYLFATTDMHGKVVLLCEKPGSDSLS